MNNFLSAHELLENTFLSGSAPAHLLNSWRIEQQHRESRCENKPIKFVYKTLAQTTHIFFTNNFYAPIKNYTQLVETTGMHLNKWIERKKQLRVMQQVW